MAGKISFIGIALIMFSLPVLCDDMPVHIKADNLRYDQEAGIITAAGSVEIKFQDVVINSDRAAINTSANVATTEGHVKIWHAGYDMWADKLTYDVSNETSYVFNLKAVFYPTDMSSNLYFKADKITDLPDRKSGEFASLTTCNYDKPHYHIESRWFDYYPDDKVVGYWNILYIGDVPTPFLTPYYIYNIKKKRSPYSFVYGENDVEGKFLKTSFDYFINNSLNGEIYVDSTQLKGPGYGVLTDYKMNDKNSGSLYLYEMNEQDTHLNDYVLKLSHDIQLDDSSKLNIKTDSASIYLIPSGRENDTDSSLSYSRSAGGDSLNANYSNAEDFNTYIDSRSFSLNHVNGSYNTAFQYGESQTLLGQKTRSVSDSFSHDQSVFTDALHLSVRVNYTSYVTDEGFIANEKLTPWISMTYKGPFYSAQLTENWYVDLNADKFVGDNNTYSYLEREPELKVNFNTLDMKYFNLDLGTGAARYHEAQYDPAYARMRNITSNSYWFTSNFTRSDNLGLGTVLHSGIGYNQYEYELGDERFSYTESLNMQTNWGRFFSNNADWGRSRVAGNTPFFFESLGSLYNYIKDTITLSYNQGLTQHISGGYNYMNSTYDDIVTDLNYSPSQNLTMFARSGWSIENQLYRDLEGNISYSPWDRLTASGGLVYDLNYGLIKSANSVVDLTVGDTWENSFHFKMEHSYDFTTNQYILQNLAVVKDLHCWEATFSYSDYMKEWRFGMTLKAFPTYPLTYVTGAGGSYMNSFMDDMHFEQQSPTRN